MNKKVRTLEDLRDSKLLYDKKLPAFGYILVTLVALLLVGILIWSIFTPKVYIIKGSGVVESSNKNYIMPAYSGEIEEIYIKNGDMVEEGEVLLSVKSTDLNLQQIQIEEKLKAYEKQLSQLKKLEESIKKDTNYFDEKNLDDIQYYNQFETYKSKVAQSSLDVSTYKQYGYTDQQIEAEIKKNQGKIDEIYYSALGSIGQSMDSITAEKESLMAQAQAVAEGQEEYKVRAQTSGSVYMSTPYKKGMVVQAGNALGSIAAENSKCTISAYINANDVTRAEVGNRVDIAVGGLIESQYGTIEGTLIQIDSDVTTWQSSGEEGTASQSGGYFRVEIEPDIDYLISKSGRKYNLTNGTMVEARIKYDEITYFEYLLEALGLLVR